MSWQEQLRRIDAALAAGKLSKEQYAAKREELLAEASSTPSPSPKPNDVKLPKRPQPDVSAHALLTTDRPTTAPSPADERPTDSMAHPGKPQRSAKEPARIAIGELPPPTVVAATAADPPRSDPHGNDATGPTQPASAPQRTVTVRRWLFVATGLVLALAVFGGGLWWLAAGGDEEHGADDQPPAAPSSAVPTTAVPDLVDRLPELPGVFNLDSGTYSVSEGLRRKLFGPGEAAVFRDNGVREVTWKGSYRASQNGSTGFVVMVARHPSPGTAESTAKVLRRIGNHNAKRVKFVDVDNVSTYRQETRSLTVYFAVFRSDRNTVHVSVGRTGDGDDRLLRAEIQDLLERVTAVLPPS